jgi:hypothetical protein
LTPGILLGDLRKNLLNGVGLGLFVATGFSAWVTFLRLRAGTSPFDRLHTTYLATVELYYAGGLVGGTLVGLFLPLRRWPLGAALLGMLGVFPLYFGAALATSGAMKAFTRQNLASSGVLAFLVGGAVGIWSWLDDNPESQGVMHALRHPSSRTVMIVWIIAVALAAGSYFGLSRWTGSWAPDLVILLAFVLFVIPVFLAALVTWVWVKGAVK